MLWSRVWHVSFMTRSSCSHLFSRSPLSLSRTNKSFYLPKLWTLPPPDPCNLHSCTIFLHACISTMLNLALNKIVSISDLNWKSDICGLAVMAIANREIALIPWTLRKSHLRSALCRTNMCCQSVHLEAWLLLLHPCFPLSLSCSLSLSLFCSWFFLSLARSLSCYLSISLIRANSNS